MAVDIDKALLSIFQEEGSMDEAAAHAFLKELISSKHYLKDVY
jgi:sulfite reductase alpha subunit-like flavoprotein